MNKINEKKISALIEAEISRSDVDGDNAVDVSIFLHSWAEYAARRMQENTLPLPLDDGDVFIFVGAYDDFCIDEWSPGSWIPSAWAESAWRIWEYLRS